MLESASSASVNNGPVVGSLLLIIPAFASIENELENVWQVTLSVSTQDCGGCADLPQTP